ncbi:hypothetical protein D2U37_23795 [Salmonella enterica]|nr:hypothetical protein [Salmonella enterica]
MTTDREAVRGHSVYAGLVGNRKYKGEGKSRSNKRAAEGTHVDNGGRTIAPRDRRERQKRSALNKYSFGLQQSQKPPKRGLLSDMACLVSLELSIGGYAGSDFVGIICTTSIAK